MKKWAEKIDNWTQKINNATIQQQSNLIKLYQKRLKQRNETIKTLMTEQGYTKNQIRCVLYLDMNLDQVRGTK